MRLLMFYVALACLIGVCYSQETPGEVAEDAKRKRAPILQGSRKPKNGRAERAFCVELTNGWSWYLPTNTWQFKFKTTKFGNYCNTQGIVTVRKPKWAYSLSLHLVFDKPSGHTFNIGNSKTNKGFGDGGTDKYDAEMFSKTYTVRAFANTRGGNARFANVDVIKTALYIRIYKHDFYMTNYAGMARWYWPGDNFNWMRFNHGGYMYIGLNRMIADFYGKPAGTGEGLCSACMYWT